MTMRMAVAVALVVLVLAQAAVSLPLSTKGRWLIDDATGQRVKLRGANWVSHMEVLLAEGLSNQPLPKLIAQLPALGFNSVRLTWPTYLFTRSSYGNRTVTESFKAMNLTAGLAGIEEHNPEFLNKTAVDAFVAVVDSLGDAGVMVVLDNHVSLPQWCCNNTDGNGFFGDKYFDPKEWERGLHTVASVFQNKPQVVGMSLRNEMRGKIQNVPDWYRYVTRGVKTIHHANPNLLVIVSGISYATDLTFIRHRPLKVNIGNKLVFESHWYCFSNGNGPQWKNSNPNYVCPRLTKHFQDMTGFVATDLNMPFFLSEFGVNIKEPNIPDTRFLACFLLYALEGDFDFALWAWQGGYYHRENKNGPEEYFGVMNATWNGPKDPRFKERHGLLLDMVQDPLSAGTPHSILYNPLSGLCAQANKDKKILEMAGCLSRSPWTYEADGDSIKLMGTDLCLRMSGEMQPVSVSDQCSDAQSRWMVVGSARNQIAAMDPQGKLQCLETNTNTSTTLYTRKCMCLEGRICKTGDSLAQWFRLIPSNILVNPASSR